MKCSQVEIILAKDQAAIAGQARLAKEDDTEVTTEEQAIAYRGPVFIEGQDCKNLHALYRDGMVCVNFTDDSGERVNYDYPIHSIRRVKRID